MMMMMLKILLVFLLSASLALASNLRSATAVSTRNNEDSSARKLRREGGGQGDDTAEPALLVHCMADVKKCDDGSYVSRNPNDDCQFDPCPLEQQRDCTRQECGPRPLTPNHLCWDGVTMAGPGDYCVRNANDGTCEWEFVNCPVEQHYCADDVRMCPDGTTVSRNPYLKCEFDSCSCCNPKDEPGMFGNAMCFEGHQCCPSGEWVCSNGDGRTFSCGGNDKYTGPFGHACKKEEEETSDVCEEQDCGPESRAPNYLCSDGVTMAGPTDQCEYDSIEKKCTWAFVRCPDELGCPKDAKTCPDGTVVSRNMDLDCNFDPCPPPNNDIKDDSCCDPTIAMTCFIGTPQCCPVSGEWACPNGDTGIYVCNGEETKGPFSEPCKSGDEADNNNNDDCDKQERKCTELATNVKRHQDEIVLQIKMIHQLVDSAQTVLLSSSSSRTGEVVLLDKVLQDLEDAKKLLQEARNVRKSLKGLKEDLAECQNVLREICHKSD